MVATIQVPRLGTGLYTPREAAAFARLRTETFNRWFFGSTHREAALRPRIEPASEGSDYRLITFVDLIQAVAVRTLRRSEKGSRITLPHIRAVVDACQKRGIDFPLARKHTLYWYADRLILKTGDDVFVGTTPRIDLQQMYHGKILEPFLEEVAFVDDFARQWTPLESAEFKISLDADRRFGMPAVHPGGILVSALVDAAVAEGSIDGAAEAFETKPEAVSLALKYSDYLSPAA